MRFPFWGRNHIRAVEETVEPDPYSIESLQQFADELIGNCLLTKESSTADDPFESVWVILGRGPKYVRQFAEILENSCVRSSVGYTPGGDYASITLQTPYGSIKVKVVVYTGPVSVRGFENLMIYPHAKVDDLTQALKGQDLTRNAQS